MTMSDMFIAGSETTSNTLRWTILLMAVNPKVIDIAEVYQQKVTMKDFSYCFQIKPDCKCL